MVDLQNGAVDQTVANLVAPVVAATRNKLFRRLQSKVDIEVAAEQLGLLPRFVKVTGTEDEDAGGLVRPLVLQLVLDHLAVQFGYRVSLRVAVVNDSVKVVQLAILLLGVEAGQVLGCHEMRPERLALESNLARGSRRHADYEWRVVDGAEDLKCVAFLLETASVVIDR